MGTINLGPPPVGENSRFELEVRLDPDNGCRIVPPQRVGEGEMEERDWERSQSRRPKVSGVELESREGGGRGRFVEADISGFRGSRVWVSPMHKRKAAGQAIVRLSSRQDARKYPLLRIEFLVFTLSKVFRVTWSNGMVVSIRIRRRIISKKVYESIMLRIIAYYYFLEIKYLMTISINFHKYIYRNFLLRRKSIKLFFCGIILRNNISNLFF